MKKFLKIYPIVLILLFLLGFVFAVSSLDHDRRAEGKEHLEDTLRRTSVTCYAVEGFYPPDLDYMSKNYGLTYDEDRYVVYYELFASNLMPVITVLEK